MELTPYVVTKNVQRAMPNSRYTRDQQITGGGDIKLGITPNVTLDATVNPDFGQVEADPSVVNLTAFETFFAEHRPFFVEGTGLYQFQLNCYIVVDCSTNEGLFYSRRIGRSPSLRDDYGDASTPSATPIAAATKLTGRSARGLSFGVLDAVTERVTGVNSATVEPLTNYGVLRAQQDLRGGEAGISVIATAVNRSLDDLTAPVLHRGAYTTGATFRNRFAGGKYELAGQFAGSYVTGTPAALLLTQTSSVHYFQQPGDDSRVDSDAHLARRTRRADQVRQVRRRCHALRDEPAASVRRVRGERPRLPPSRRHRRLEHLGRAVVQKRSRHLQLGSGQRQPLGAVEHVGNASRERRSTSTDISA